MDLYRSDIMKALDALKRQRDEVKRATGKGEVSSEDALKDGKTNGVVDDPAALQTRAGEQGGSVNGEHLDSVPLDEEDTGRSAHDLPTPTSPTNSLATPQPKAINPKLRSARRKGNNGITFSDYAGVDTLINSPTIVKLKDGSYIELRCDLCGGNTSWAHNTVMSGVRGFLTHFRLMHNTNLKVHEVLQRCMYRDVPAEEVDRIINGEHKIELIYCESKANLKSDTVYIGQSAVGSGSLPKRGARTVEALETVRAKDNTDTNDANKPRRKRTTKAKDSTTDTNTSSTPTSPKPKPTPKRDHSAPHLSNCPIIVRTLPSNPTQTSISKEATYIELRCSICGGNGSFSSGKLLYGIKGFKAHYREIHKEHLSTDEVLSRCRYREVPGEEVKAIQEGKRGVGFVRCEGSERVRPKKSYRDFVVREV